MKVLKNYMAAALSLAFLYSLYHLFHFIRSGLKLYEISEYPPGQGPDSLLHKALFLSYGSALLFSTIIITALLIFFLQRFIFVMLRRGGRKPKTAFTRQASPASLSALFLTAILFITLDKVLFHPATPITIIIAFIIFFATNAAGNLLSPLIIKMLIPLRKNKLCRLFARGIAYFSTGYFILSICVSIFGYYRQNRETAPRYNQLKSTTDLDINVILIVIDALRADHLGCYGYERKTSPNMDAFARRGVLFLNCYTQASWTKPSVASILTSLYPGIHGTSRHVDVLPEEVTSLAEILQSAGWITYGYVANPNLKAIFNYDQGFDFFDDYPMREKVRYALLREPPSRSLRYLLAVITGRSGEYSDRDNIRLANRRILPWLERYRDENFFMYLHYNDPHAPYHPPREYRNIFAYDKNSRISYEEAWYDGEIRYLDDNIIDLLDELQALGLDDRTLIILTSDHGEEFGEHGNFRHGATIYQEQLRVPLIMKFPPLIPAGKSIETAVRSIDITPTILDILRISFPNKLEGRSLLPLIAGDEDEDHPESVFIEENYDDEFIFDGIVKENTWKYILTRRSKRRDVEKFGREELYNIGRDPGERNDLAGTEHGIMEDLRSELDSFHAHCRSKALSPSRTVLDKETIRQLEAIGYLQ